MLRSDYDSGTGLKNAVVIEDCELVFFPQPTPDARPTNNRVAKQIASSRLPAVAVKTLP